MPSVLLDTVEVIEVATEVEVVSGAELVELDALLELAVVDGSAELERGGRRKGRGTWRGGRGRSGREREGGVAC